MARKLARPEYASLGTANDIEDIVYELVDLEPESFGWEGSWSHGSIQHGERVFQVAVYAAERWSGDLVEIGCMAGAMTARFGAIAKAHGRRVLAVDPWETGTQNCEGWEYDAFLENTKLVCSVIDVMRMRSQSPHAIRHLGQRHLSFALVDGSHEYHDCLSDILAVGHAPIICVDDVLWNTRVKQAFQQGAAQTGKQMVTHEMAKEGYLIG